MIKPAETLLLASTKLRTRRIRLIITVLITSLLFSVLVFVACVGQGSIHSLKDFSREGYGGKFYVQATPLTYQVDPSMFDSIKKDLLPFQNDLVAKKKAEAKKLDLSYDEKSDQSLPLQVVSTGPSSTDTYPNTSSQVVQDYVNKLNLSIPGVKYEDFSRLAKKAGAVNIYRGTQSTSAYGGQPNSGGQATIIVNGKEDLSSFTQNSNSGPPSTSGVASITSLGWRSLDESLLQPFVLPGQNMAIGKDASVPMVAPFSAAEEILGLKPLPQTATPEQKLARVTEVRKGIAGQPASMCYRNSASVALLSQAIQQEKDITANKNNKDYSKPHLIYQVPSEACGEVKIKTDNRTSDEISQAENQKKFDQDFGQYVEPGQGIINLRIIGISPDNDQGSKISLNSVLSSILASSVGAGWVSPAKAVESNSLASTVQGGNISNASVDKLVYYAEFSNLKQMQSFIDDQTCEGVNSTKTPNGSTITFSTDGQGGYIKKCIDQKKVFTVSTYGNSAGAIEEFRKSAWKVLKYVLLVIVLVAALIMMGNVGKIIADSRRETAVFRALGARRLDITQIYLTYTLLVSLLVSGSALLVGFVAAKVLSDHFSPDLSVSAVIAYNAQDIHKQFTLFGFSLSYLLSIISLIIIAGLLSALLPLLTNTRRNPIRDMRDEN